jgi:hypothetical protein
MIGLVAYLLLGLLIVITPTRQSNTDSLGNVTNSLAPDVFVEGGVNADVTVEQANRQSG